MDALYTEVKRSLALEEIIRAEIAGRGPMTFARFMELSLYHPALGYYRSGGAPMTRAGDFLTAPETHPAFGALLARFARAASKALSAPDFTVIEQGAGTGALSVSFLRYWQAAYPAEPLRYVIVEPDPAARASLSARLEPSVEVVEDLPGAPGIEGLYLSNELPDAFPVHRVRRRGASLVEVYVAEQDGRLVEEEGPPSSADLLEYLKFSDISLSDGAEIEVNPGLSPWLDGVSRSLQRGYVLTIDYGYAGNEAARFPRGTLLAHYRHATNEDLLERIGRQDLTAHVCWTALERYGASFGLSALERLTQREFLVRWGWKEYSRWLISHGTPAMELDALDRLGRIEDGMGGFGVLLQGKEVTTAPDPEDAGPVAWEAVRQALI